MKQEKSKRQLQIGEQMRRFIANNINNIIDTRINGDILTIMKVEASKDLRYYKLFYRCKVENKQLYNDMFENIKEQLANITYKNLCLRIRPNFSFVFDDTLILINEIEEVYKKYGDK